MVKTTAAAAAPPSRSTKVIVVCVLSTVLLEVSSSFLIHSKNLHHSCNRIPAMTNAIIRTPSSKKVVDDSSNNRMMIPSSSYPHSEWSLHMSSSERDGFFWGETRSSSQSSLAYDENSEEYKSSQTSSSRNLPIKIAEPATENKLKFDLGSFDEDDGKMRDVTKMQNPYHPHTWRQAPEESLSDWTIVVTIKGDPQPSLGGNNDADNKPLENVKKYNVHKFVVGIGPRASEYMLGLFKSAKQMSSTTYVELEASAAEAFPNMLDFMYDMYSTDVKVTTETAVAVRYLATYFRVPALFDSVNKFIQNNISKENIHIYLKEANLYQDDKIIDATMKVAALAWEEFLDNQISPTYVEQLPPSKLVGFFKLVGQVNAQLVQQLQDKQKEIELFEPLDPRYGPPAIGGHEGKWCIHMGGENLPVYYRKNSL